MENEIEKTPATITTEANTNASLMPVKFGDRYKMAQILAASNLMPANLKTPEQLTVALQWGYELGLSPMVSINNIAVVNGRPTLSTDIMHAVARRSPEYAGCKWVRQDDRVAECIIYRKTATYTEEVRGFYSIEMAAAAGLTNKDNWKKYPARMLKHRALSYALRDAFPDVLAAIYTEEELEPTPAAEIRNITPPDELAKSALNTQKAENYASETIDPPDGIF